MEWLRGGVDGVSVGDRVEDVGCVFDNREFEKVS